MSLGAYHRLQLQIIFDAHDILREVSREHWNNDDYFNILKSKTNNGLFGHYVLSLPEFRATDPKSIPNNTYMVKAAPLASAINTFVSLLLDDDHDAWDAYSIAKGLSPVFPQKHPYDRAMALFQLIERAYPRKLHPQEPSPVPFESDTYVEMPLSRLEHTAKSPKI